MTLTPLQKLPKNVMDVELDKIIVAKGIKKLP